MGHRGRAIRYVCMSRMAVFIVDLRLISFALFTSGVRGSPFEIEGPFLVCGYPP